MSVVRRQLAAHEAAVVVRSRGRPPLLIVGPASVRTLGRWRQTSFVDLAPFCLELSVEHVGTEDDGALDLDVEVDARVVNAIEAATKVADYSRATGQMTETVLRSVCRERQSLEIVTSLTGIEADVLATVKVSAGSWGIDVRAIRLRLLNE